jgi:hypothetical protein
LQEAELIAGDEIAAAGSSPGLLLLEQEITKKNHWVLKKGHR